MQRRTFLQILASLLGLAALPVLVQAAPRRRYLILACPLARFLQYHHGDFLWPQLKTGDRLTLAREPDNPHDADADAIRIDWNGHKLGYLPRDRNMATARLLDESVSLESRISRLEEHPNPWRRVELEVWLVV